MVASKAAARRTDSRTLMSKTQGNSRMRSKTRMPGGGWRGCWLKRRNWVAEAREVAASVVWGGCLWGGGRERVGGLLVGWAVCS